MKKERFGFLSSDGKNKIAAFLYTGEERPKAVIQLSHGMCEHMGRYDSLAEFFTKRGYVVAGNDHLGHGDSVPKKEYGIFEETDVLRDLKRMNEILKERYPALPLILYGHSMGSFFARWFAKVYPEAIDGLILSGTAGPALLNRVGKAVAGLIAKTHKEGYVSKLLVILNFGAYNKKIKNPKSKCAWLTREEEIVKKYERDPKCGFSFSAKAYHSMLTVLTEVSKKSWAASLSKGLPVLLIAGEADPVGNYGKGVRKVTSMLKETGLRDVTEILDKEGRHELHNEINRKEIMTKVVKWLDKRYYE